MFFKLDALISWEGLLPKELLKFEAPEPRRVRLAFNTNAPIEVWASYPVEPFQTAGTGAVVEVLDPEMADVLIAHGTGQFEVEFTTHGTTYVRALADEETSIFVRGFTADMRVPESDEETYTSIMPRERRNTEFDRMVMWTKLNEMRREAQLQEALAQLEAVKAAVQPATVEAVSEPEPVKVEGDGA